MSVSRRVLFALLPPGRAWKIASTTDYYKFFTGLGLSYDRLKAYLNSVELQRIPAQATFLLPEWADIYGIDETLGDADKATLANEYFFSIGNQSFEYLSPRITANAAVESFEERHVPGGQVGMSRCGLGVVGGMGSTVTLKFTSSATEAQKQSVLDLLEYLKSATTRVFVVEDPTGFLYIPQAQQSFDTTIGTTPVTILNQQFQTLGTWPSVFRLDMSTVFCTAGANSCVAFEIVLNGARVLGDVSGAGHQPWRARVLSGEYVHPKFSGTVTLASGTHTVLINARRVSGSDSVLPGSISSGPTIGAWISLTNIGQAQ